MARQSRSVADDDKGSASMAAAAPITGQHSINLSALAVVREARGGKLGFNAKFIIETGEEIGSPDLRRVCEGLRDELKADFFLASDGPRLSADRPTIFLGCRGGLRITLDVNLRDGGHHSGNWGGVLSNAATILSGAIASLVDKNGRMRLEAMRPPRISNQIRSVLADVKVEPSADDRCSRRTGARRAIGGRRLFAGTRLKCWRCRRAISQALRVRFRRAHAVLQLRCRRHQNRSCRRGGARHLCPKWLSDGRVNSTLSFAAARTDFVAQVNRPRNRSGRPPAGAGDPAEFRRLAARTTCSEALALPTIWVPHSYPGCSQHAPNEHILLPVTEEALAISRAVWDLVRRVDRSARWRSCFSAPPRRSGDLLQQSRRVLHVPHLATLPSASGPSRCRPFHLLARCRDAVERTLMRAAEGHRVATLSASAT